MKRRNDDGLTLPFIAVVAFGLGLMMLFVSRSLQINSGQMLYFNDMSRTYRLAETGLSQALGLLSINPSTGSLNGIGQVEVPGEGYFENYAQPNSEVIPNGFYILTTANRTNHGRDYSSRLHTYALVANVGDYFAAVSDYYGLSPGMDASGGKIYAPSITFFTERGKTTKVEKVEYRYGIQAVNIDNPPEHLPNWDPTTWASANILGFDELIEIGASPPGTDLPVKLDNLKMFPQVRGGELARYETLAGPHNIVSDFTPWYHVYPPGYQGGPDPTCGGCDPYENHSTENADHVYYSTDTIRIGRPDPNYPTRIHGQILFVSGQDIEIYGSVINYDNTSWFPGEGSVNSSTAHQAVFITQNDIIIKTNGLLPGSITTIHAFLFAPNGRFVVENNPAIPDAGLQARNLSFDFLGSKIFGTMAPPRENLPSQFYGTRTYKYMQTLKTNPPPYLPALAEIYYSLEEITGSANLY